MQNISSVYQLLVPNEPWFTFTIGSFSLFLYFATFSCHVDTCVQWVAMCVLWDDITHHISAMSRTYILIFRDCLFWELRSSFCLCTGLIMFLWILGKSWLGMSYCNIIKDPKRSIKDLGKAFEFLWDSGENKGYLAPLPPYVISLSK